jgi:long-subunit acyl-CoA synthetase (AMP-forming)
MVPTLLSVLLVLYSGAAYLPEEIRQKFNGLSKGLDCGQGWGMSECVRETIAPNADAAD